MMVRMYVRYLTELGFEHEIDDLQSGEEAGIKSATLTAEGEHAYAVLEAERGVHRLVRISPFDSNARRHTSFAGVDVVPLVEDAAVEISPDDLRIDTYRSQGAGGQHVNTTDSAVRITHLPTGLVVTCQDEKSQLQNKEKAFRVLRARLYQEELLARAAERAAGRRSQIGTGDRSEKIRTYNFRENRVTDHRIGLVIRRLTQVLDGQLSEFVDALTSDQATRRMIGK
jgi:protein subunit release factor A